MSSATMPRDILIETERLVLRPVAEADLDAIVLRGVVAVGAEFPTHSHDRQEVLVIVSGTASYTIGDEQGVVSGGDVVIVPAGALHSFEAIEDIDAIAVLPGRARTFAPDGSEIESRV